MMRRDGRLSDTALKAWGGKLPGNTVRIAGLLHCAETAPVHQPDAQKIDARVMIRAVAMMKVLIEHAIAAHDLAVSDSNRSRALQILDWLRANRHLEITIRMVQQALKQRADFRTAADVRSAFQILVENGWLLRSPCDRERGRPKEIYSVHAELYPQNPQKAG